MPDQIINNSNGGSQLMMESIKAKADQKRSRAEKFADWLTEGFGSMFFLVFNVILFIVWIVWNKAPFAGMVPFDPFPFSLLTSAVSLEAIILAIIVFMSQNRSSKIAELREELHLQINFMAEREITKVISMLLTISRKLNVDLLEDEELKRMLQETDPERLERMVNDQINHRNHSGIVTPEGASTEP